MEKYYCKLLLTVFFLFSFVSCSHNKHIEITPWETGAFETQKYRNIFTELGYSKEQVDEKLQGIFQNLFFGPNKIYFEVGDSMAYISDVKNHDVRTEGMSYGMMIAVQLNKKDVF